MTLNRKTFWAAAGKALAVATLILTVVLMLPPIAGAATKYKTLYKFTGGADGNASEAGLIFDEAGNLHGTTSNGGAHGCSQLRFPVVTTATPDRAMIDEFLSIYDFSATYEVHIDAPVSVVYQRLPSHP